MTQQYSLDIVLIMMIFFFMTIIGLMIVWTIYFTMKEKKDNNITYYNQPKQNSVTGASVDTIKKTTISDKQKEQILKNYQNAGFHFTDITLEFFTLKDYETPKQFQKDIEKIITKNTKQ